MSNALELYRSLSPKEKRAFKANLMLQKKQRKARKEAFNVNNAYEWIVKSNFTNENGMPMEFADRSFLIAPLCDESKLLAVIKCSQIGYSTAGIFKTMYHNIK